jgi:phenylpropionate dioxygenase-like ring-hydroxylating dioxygenase large terminal subunit
MLDRPAPNHFDHLVDLTKGEINRSIFSAPAIYQRELECIFAKCWLLLGHESLLKKPNDYFSAYMGQDPIIVTRAADGKIRALLNMCRHRGNRVCRGDAGNARAFTCPYHGWTFRNTGKLDSVPGFKEVYLEKLDLESHGLVQVAKLDTYKGLIFATFHADAPSLLDYLGDMAWYLDMILDRREGGIEFLPGVHKWMLNCNWKFPTDNFIGDSYHGPVSHQSAWSTGFEGMPRRKKGYGYEGFQISPGNGHGFGARWAENREQVYEMALPEFLAYEQERAPETEARLGELRGMHLSPMHGSIFPNVSLLWQSGNIRVWHPRGPAKTEAWAWCFVDKKASPEHRNLVRIHDLQRHGTSGTWEQDDVDNWVQSTNSSNGYVARQYRQVISMGLNDEIEDARHIHPDLRGRVGKFQSEINQRAFYRHWSEMLSDHRTPALVDANA